MGAGRPAHRLRDDGEGRRGRPGGHGVCRRERRHAQGVHRASAVYSGERARKDGFKVLLSGQGADELFGGYARYESAARDGKLPEALDHDLRHIAEVNLERDDAATMAHGIELRVPYLDMRVVAASRRTDPSLKVHFERQGLYTQIRSKKSSGKIPPARSGVCAEEGHTVRHRHPENARQAGEIEGLYPRRQPGIPIQERVP